jgi:tRNA modification GTPase
MSGRNACEILDMIWRGGVDPKALEPRKLHLGNIFRDGHIIDRVMAVMMPSPNTYTGQDVVEFSCHGSPVVLKKIMDLCIASGARPAGPGEFTRRAFLAGKMDLAQAEAVCDLIHASSEAAARQAFEQLSGGLSKKLSEIAEGLLELRALVEASIDFPEEDLTFIENDDTAGKISLLEEKLRKISDTFNEGKLIKNGVRTAIVGKPNVGKSSILNALAGSDRAIVYHEPGTTRDVIEQDVVIDGILFHLRDTAGIRPTSCGVESAGVMRSKNEMKNADLILVVIDSSIPPDDEDISLVEKAGRDRCIIVCNKTDLTGAFNPLECLGKFGCKVMGISAKVGTGLTETAAAMADFVSENRRHHDSALITSQRHRDTIEKTRSHLLKAASLLSEKASAEFLAEELRYAHERLGEITGETASDDVLNRIFSEFCIGK